MEITKRSPVSGEFNTMDLPITPEQLERWNNGELIQNVFPDLSPSDREFIMTGIMPNEWQTIFPEKDRI